MLKLKLQNFGHLMQRADSMEKTLMLGKTEGRRRGHRRMRWLESITDAMNMNLGKLQEIVKDSKAWHAAVHRVACELWYWRRLLRVPWTARRSNSSVLKEISPEDSFRE